MLALVIIGVILLIITLIMLVPVGADIGYEGGELKVSAKVCGMLLQLVPKPPSDGKKPGKEKKAKEKKPKRPKKEKPKKEKPKLDFTKDELLGLVRAVLRGFGRFGRKLSVDRFLFRYVAAGDDPYNTALTYNYVNAALSSLTPVCARRFTVKDCQVTTDIDFMADKTSLDLGLALTIRIGQIFGVVFTIIFGALGILLKNKKRLKRERKLAPKEAPPPQTETGETINKENIQAEERMDSNG